MAESIKKGYGAGTVFGEPIQVGQGITIIPVAKVKIAGGGGGGEEQSGNGGEGDEGKVDKAKGKGGGFGFKGGVKPVGYIMIKGDKARWVGIPDVDRMMKCLIPLGICALVILKRKMLHMKLKKMGYMGHGMGPFGPKMMHRPPWACGGMHHAGYGGMHKPGYGVMQKPPWMYGGMHKCGHGHEHPHHHGGQMHHHHHEHHGEHHPPCEHSRMGMMKPPDWRAKKKRWMAEKKAEGESAQA